MASKDLKIPVGVLRSKNLTPTAKLVLGTLLDKAIYQEPNELTIDGIASSVGVPSPQVRHALSELGGANMLGMASEPGGPDISIAESSAIAVHFELHLELRRNSIDGNGQKSMNLDESEVEETEDGVIVSVEGVPFEMTITNDIEDSEGNKVFLNVWRLEDDKTRVAHVVQGAQFDYRYEADQWWENFTARAEINVLDWLVTLPIDDTDASGNPYTYIDDKSFACVLEVLREKRAPSLSELPARTQMTCHQCTCMDCQRHPCRRSVG